MRLVVDSGQILVKCAVLPKVSHKQILQFVKDEFIDVESQYTDLLYDYAIIKDKLLVKQHTSLKFVHYRQQVSHYQHFLFLNQVKHL